MFQASQDLAFSLESCYRRTGSKSTFHQLNGYTFLIFVIGANGLKDGSHAAFADLFLNQVRTNPAPYPELRRRWFAPRFRMQISGGPFEEFICFVVREDQGLNVTTHLGLGTDMIEIAGAIFHRDLQNVIENVTNLNPGDRHINLPRLC